MPRCKHQDGELVEIMTATHTRQVRDGKLSEIGNNEVEGITGYEYTCLACKKTFRYKAGVTLRLKWLINIHDQL